MLDTPTDEESVAEILSPDARRIVALLARRWSLPILASLTAGPFRHGQLRRAIDGVADKVLVETLRALEDEELVDRSVFAEVPLRVVYELTDKAWRLCDALGAVDEWAHREAALLSTVRSARGAVGASCAHHNAEEDEQ